MTDRSKLLALAEQCQDRAASCADMATDYDIGGEGSTLWIAEAAHYAAVAASLRIHAAQAEALA